MTVFKCVSVETFHSVTTFYWTEFIQIERNQHMKRRWCFLFVFVAFFFANHRLLITHYAEHLCVREKESEVKWFNRQNWIFDWSNHLNDTNEETTPIVSLSLELSIVKQWTSLDHTSIPSLFWFIIQSIVLISFAFNFIHTVEARKSQVTETLREFWQCQIYPEDSEFWLNAL